MLVHVFDDIAKHSVIFMYVYLSMWGSARAVKKSEYDLILARVLAHSTAHSRPNWLNMTHNTHF